MSTLKVGVVGYTHPDFNPVAGKRLLLFAIETAIADNSDVDTVEIVSSLVDRGIPGLAYELAVDHGWMTAGIACAKAFDYPHWPVDREVIVGTSWGDESLTFLTDIDVLVRVGGGLHSVIDVANFRQMGGHAFEYELPLELVPA
jgi:hypothetical protein